jgi:ketosteroid isomerase-like protein
VSLSDEACSGKRGFEWWNCGEIDLTQDRYAEDAEFDLSAVFTDMSPISGRASMRRQWDKMAETWAGLRTDPIEVFDAGRGRYVVDLRLWGKGNLSGVEIDQRFGCVYTLRGGDNRIVRFQLFPSLQAAIDFATLAPAG